MFSRTDAGSLANVFPDTGGVPYAAEFWYCGEKRELDGCEGLAPFPPSDFDFFFLNHLMILNFASLSVCGVEGKEEESARRSWPQLEFMSLCTACGVVHCTLKDLGWD